MTDNRIADAIESNRQRAGCAEATLAHYFALKNPEMLPMDREAEAEETLVDVLTDLRHWANQNGVDFNKADIMAAGNFTCEAQDGESAQEDGVA